MDRAARKLYFNRCDPSEPLGPEDDRAVDLDAQGARGASWTEAVAARIELSDEPVYELFTGLPGTGVTTELRRLSARLGRGDRPWLTVRVDAGEVFDLTSTVHPIDLLLGILDQVTEEVSALDKETASADPFTPDPWIRRFRSWVGSDEANRPGSPSFSAKELRADAALRERVRKHVSMEISRFTTDVHDELVLLHDHVRRHGREGIVVVVDSLQRLRGMSANAREVLASAERMFRKGTWMLRLPVHVVYTVPPALLVGRLTDPVELLPCIRVRERDGSRSPSGYETARELVRRRIPDEHLAEILGSAALADRMEQLITRTGGHPGDLVRALQRLIAAGERKLSPTAFRRILGEGAETYVAGLPAGAYPLLARVAVEKPAIPPVDGSAEVAEAVFASGAVLPYRNGERWLDVHPAVLALPGVRESVERLASA
jgi:hypothetical protein